MNTNKEKTKTRQLVRRTIGKLHPLRNNAKGNMTRKKKEGKERRRCPKCSFPQPAVYSELSQIQSCP
jgi:hypothetical protein